MSTTPSLQELSWVQGQHSNTMAVLECEVRGLQKQVAQLMGQGGEGKHAIPCGSCGMYPIGSKKSALVPEETVDESEPFTSADALTEGMRLIRLADEYDKNVASIKLLTKQLAEKMAALGESVQ